MVRTLTPAELVDIVKTKVAARWRPSSWSDFHAAPRPADPGVYALVVGAGFSHPVVPLARDLMNRSIGDYYYGDQDMSSMPRSDDVLEANAVGFWAELNEACRRDGLPLVDLDEKGLPVDAGAAYQNLFAFRSACALFEGPRGEAFVRGFLRYPIIPGGEHGQGFTGRVDLNGAHLHLAALLEAQQRGEIGPFCRTIFTTNFDTLLQNALQMVNMTYMLTDRPERSLEPSDFPAEEAAIHLVYTHGSILRHNPASSNMELAGLAGRNAETLRAYLRSRDVIAIGYGGWKDSIMAALQASATDEHNVYWCNIRPQPPDHVADLLDRYGDRAAYIHLGEDGADGLMRALYDAMIPPARKRDVWQRFRDWHALVRS